MLLLPNIHVVLFCLNILRERRLYLQTRFETICITRGILQTKVIAVFCTYAVKHAYSQVVLTIIVAIYNGMFCFCKNLHVPYFQERYYRKKKTNAGYNISK